MTELEPSSPTIFQRLFPHPFLSRVGQTLPFPPFASSIRAGTACLRFHLVEGEEHFHLDGWDTA